MPANIRKAVSVIRPLIEGKKWASRLDGLVARYATSAFYSPNSAYRAETVDRLRRDIVREVVRRDFSLAKEAGRVTAKPILETLTGSGKITSLGDVQNVLRQSNPADLRNELRAIRKVFVADLKTRTQALSPAVEAAFARAARDKQARSRLVRNMIDADKAEFTRLREVEAQIVERSEKLREVMGTGDGRKIKPAQKALRDAKRARISTKSMLARFAVQVHADARDAIRRVAQESQFAYFKEAGYEVFTWVSVNGSDACPSCEDRHGMTQKASAWSGDGPGEGGTLCGDSCMCMLVPDTYAASNQGLKKPIREVPVTGKNQPGKGTVRTKPAPEPIRTGGDAARQAREVAKRAKDPARPTPTRRLPDNRAVYGTGGREYVRSPSSTMAGDQVVMVDPKKVDRYWREDASYYVPKSGKGGGAIKGRYDRFGKWIESAGEPVEMSEMGLRVSTLKDGTEVVEVGFDNGRHRFAWLRDHGAGSIPVAVDKGTAAKVARLVGITKTPQ